jgi:hypothetical protein
MTNVYLATLGQRPEAITVALDLLSERYTFTEAVILHTEPQVSGIAGAYRDLQAVFAQDYPDLSTRWYELTGIDGSPLMDIESQATANHYYQAVLDVLLEYKRQGYALQLMIAGGRKAMSIYATLAAGVLFGRQDRVWTVLSPPAMLNTPRQFHVPAGLRHEIQLVQLPLLPARLVGGHLPDDVDTYLQRRRDLRTDFFLRLTLAEQEVAEVFTQHPYHFNEDLAEVLGKSKRTIDNQFASIYQKLALFLDAWEDIGDKRAALRDLLLGRY